MRYYRLKLCRIFVSLWIMSYWGCSSSLQQIYEGRPLSIGEIAQVSCTNFISEILDIDGDRMTNIKHSFFTGGSNIALLPGTHTLTVVFPSHEERTLTFTVEAGQSYELDRWGDNAVLIDIQNKKMWSEYQNQLYKGTTDELIDKQIKSFVAPTPSENDVIVRSLEHNPAVALISIDNKRNSSINSGFALRLAPGLHTFEIWAGISRGFFQQDLHTPQTIVISDNLEPGCTYVIYSRIVDFKAKKGEVQLVKDMYHSVQSEIDQSNP